MNEADTNAKADKVKMMLLRRYIFWGIGVSALIIGINNAFSLKFVNDDAFISFRYAKNLVNGLGPVYNAGERVEGFTNFLWTMMIAAGLKTGIDPVTFSTALGVFFHACTLTLFCFISYKTVKDKDVSVLVFPLTSLALSVHRDFNVYATSGLETSMFTFFISGIFALLLLGRSQFSLVGAGMLAVLAMMTRPDGIIFFFAASAYLAITRKDTIRSFVLFLAPIVLLFLPYWLIRYNYYGFFFPNPFYAKSISISYYGQGLRYIGMYFKTYYVLLAIFPFLLTLLWKSRRILPANVSELFSRLRSESFVQRPVLLSLLFIGAQLLFIIRIGGDFMFARFCIPITPMLFFLTESLINRISSRVIYIAFSFLLIGSTYFRNDIYTDRKIIDHVADEWQWYSAEHLRQSQSNAEQLKKYFAGLPVTVAIWGEGARLVYYADIPTVIEASTGLTDTSIAHQQLSSRGRPGHEKPASLEYLYKRKVNFLFAPVYAEFATSIVDYITFDDMTARIVVYEDSIMTRLAQYPGIKFVRFPEALDQYIIEIHTYPRAEVEHQYKRFKAYYFDHNSDARREKIFLDYLGISKETATQR